MIMMTNEPQNYLSNNFWLIECDGDLTVSQHGITDNQFSTVVQIEERVVQCSSAVQPIDK